jgi:asparagine synthase (glutamine-hydrolysing)
MRDKYLLRQAAERVLPKNIAQRPKHMFQAPLADSFLVNAPEFVRELISEESLERTGYFDVEQVRRDCAAVAAEGSSRSIGRFYSLGLGGVVATQLWHHIYLGGGLCSLPAYAPAEVQEERPLEAAVSA